MLVELRWWGSMVGRAPLNLKYWVWKPSRQSKSTKMRSKWTPIDADGSEKKCPWSDFRRSGRTFLRSISGKKRCSSWCRQSTNCCSCCRRRFLPIYNGFPSDSCSNLLENFEEKFKNFRDEKFKTNAADEVRGCQLCMLTNFYQIPQFFRFCCSQVKKYFPKNVQFCLLHVFD